MSLRDFKGEKKMYQNENCIVRDELQNIKTIKHQYRKTVKEKPLTRRNLEAKE